LFIAGTGFSNAPVSCVLPPLVKHYPKLLHLTMHHLCWRFLAKESICSAKPMPQVIDLMGLVADERCGVGDAFAFLQPFADRFLFRGQWHSINAYGVFRLREWMSAALPSGGARPRNPKSVHVVLLAIIIRTPRPNLARQFLAGRAFVRDKTGLMS
jgi:hypothetical protein